MAVQTHATALKNHSAAVLAFQIPQDAAWVDGELEHDIGVFIVANVDVLRFSGQVDPRAIQPGNTVPSAQIANVRLEHRGRGAQADAQAVGWLQRAFLSVVSPL